MYAGVTLLVGVLGVPALAWQGLDRLMPLLPASIVAAVTGVGYGVVGVLAVVFQGVVLARMFLFLPYESERERVSEEVLRLFPDGPPVPAGPVRVVAALALPGLGGGREDERGDDRGGRLRSRRPIASRESFPGWPR
ncbi:hypothetical protein ACWEPC_05695 [Nonomuraea sp. NPDC004297]